MATLTIPSGKEVLNACNLTDVGIGKFTVLAIDQDVDSMGNLSESGKAKIQLETWASAAGFSVAGVSDGDNTRYLNYALSWLAARNYAQSLQATMSNHEQECNINLVEFCNKAVTEVVFWLGKLSASFAAYVSRKINDSITASYTALEEDTFIADLIGPGLTNPSYESEADTWR